jgi:small subunit ribosomal protein S7
MTSGPQQLNVLTRKLQILKRDEEGKENAPEVIKEEMNDKKAAAETTTFENLLALGQMQNIANGGSVEDSVDLDDPGHKFGLPELPIPSNSNLKYRYDPVVSQVTNLLMKDGKKSVAQRVGSSVSL